MRLLSISSLAAFQLLLGLPIQSHAANDTLGALFFTAEQRQAISKARRQKPDDDKGSTKMRLDGMVRYGNGRVVAWVNGQELVSGQAREGSPITLDGATVLLEHQRRLKVGQSAYPSGLEPPSDLVPTGSVRGSRDVLTGPTHLSQSAAADSKAANLQLRRSTP